MSDIGPIVLTIICVLYVLYAGRNSRDDASLDKSGNLVFALVPSFRIGLKAATLVFAGGTVLSVLDRAPGWISVFFAGMAVISGATPYVIALTPKGVERQRAWGMLTSRMDWSEIESATEVPGDGTIVLYGKNGSSISHSKYHVDHERFLAEMSNRGIAVNRQGDF